MSLDSVFADLAAKNWLVNNLYQEEPDRWRVNVRRPEGNGDWFTEWAYGPTLEEALEECMSKLTEAEYTSNLKTTFASAPPAERITNLAERLGFVTKPPTITRR